MANRYTIGSGNASNPAVWDGGATVPGTGDRVLIMAAHTITLDGTYTWGDDTTSTITINGVSTTAAVTVAGTLARRTTGNSSLTLRGSMNVVAGGRYSMGTRASPMPSTYTAELLTNYSTALADNKYAVYFRAGSYCDMFGATKKRITTLTATANAGATTIYVSDATGWNVGDQIYLANTKKLDSHHYDIVTIASGYTPGSTTVPVSALAYQHLIACPMANITSNVTAKSYNAAYRGQWFQYVDTTSVVDAFDFGYCTFDAMGYNGDGFNGFAIRQVNAVYGSNTYPACFKEFQSAVFIARDTNHAFTNYGVQKFSTPIPFNNCAFIGATTSDGSKALMDAGYSAYVDCLAAGGTTFIPEDSGNSIGWIGTWTRGWLASDTESGVALTTMTARNATLEGTTFSGPSSDIAIAASVSGPGPANWTLNNCDIASSFPRDDNTRALFRCTVFGTQANVTIKDSLVGTFPAMIAANMPLLTDSSWVKIVNRNRDITLQEEYYKYGAINRDNSVKNRSTSSLRMTPATAGKLLSRSFTISAGAGETVRLVGYCRYDTAYYNGGTGFVAPKLQIGGTINGVTLTPVTYTAPSANAGNWDLIDVSITNTSGAAGDLAVTLSAQCGVANGNAYFDGIVIAPLVVLARHYGFVFDETNPKRVVNNSISASFATADAYTGITITWGSTSTTALGSSKTFQQVYDYGQAKGVQNLTSAMPFSGSGAAGNVSMTAQGNFTTTGYTLNGGGSLAMGSYTLTANQPWAYTYTGGTFAQASTVPSFTGGQLNIGAAGTYTFGMSSGIVSMTPTAPGTYGFGAGTFAGTIDLRNTAAHAITVQVPAGTTTTTANNTGGTITVSAPTVTQGLNFTGLVAGSQVVVFATGSQTELFRDTNSATSETWSQLGGFDTVVDYTIFKDGYQPIRVTGITVNSAVVGVPVQQSVDPAFITPSGLTWGTTATVNVAGKTFAISAATTGQNWYSFMVQQWRQQATLQNVDFPLTTNGPNSVRLQRGWEFSGGLTNWTRDGLAYFDASNVRTAAWAAVLTSGTTAGHQVRYLQSDGGSFANAANTGPMDQLVQVYGDASHGNFDRTGFLVVKIQKEGFDQAEADIYGTYGTLEDQLYVVGLQAIPNGVAASSTARTITITDSPVTWQSKTWSLTIDATGVSGTQLMQWLRYSFVQAGTFQSKPTFNWHDLVQTNGAKFKTVRGVIHGDASAALKGVRVLASGAAHPDFDTFTADDGTTYSPPVTQSFTVDGLVSGSYVQIYDVTNAVQLAIGTSTTSFVWVDSGAATGDRQIRIRVAYCSGASAKEFIEVANAGTCGTTVATANKTYTVAQVDDAVYNANAIAGSGVTGITISDAIDRMQINIAGGTVSWRSIYAYNVYWLSTAAGIVDDGSIITAKDQANYSVTLFKIKNTGATPLKITQGWGVDSVTGSVEDIIDTTGNNIYPVVDHVVSSVVSVGGANIITGDIADIPAAVLAAAVTTPIHANIQKVNDVIVNGTGATGDEWGP